MATQLPPKQRNLAFDKIVKETHLDEDSVELLVMKALANGLIQGHIDQYTKNVNITWVQPRVLSTDQVSLKLMFKNNQIPFFSDKGIG
jgi:26S proteasome regulatory subunit N9